MDQALRYAYVSLLLRRVRLQSAWEYGWVWMWMIEL
jgi:hypothetical protein